MTTPLRTDPVTPEPRGPDVTRRSTLGAIVVMVLVIVADHASKAAAHAWAPPHTEANIGLFGVVRPLWNPDFSLELGGTSPAHATILAAVVAIAGTALALRLSWRGRVPLTAVGLGAGGAVANLMDRALHGAVADFLVTGPIVVNVADLAVVGAVLTVWHRSLRPR